MFWINIILMEGNWYVRRNFTKICDQFPKDIVAILVNNRYHRLKKNTIVVFEIVEDRFIYVMLLNCIEISDYSNFVEINIGEVSSMTVFYSLRIFFPLRQGNQSRLFSWFSGSWYKWGIFIEKWYIMFSYWRMRRIDW